MERFSKHTEILKHVMQLQATSFIMRAQCIKRCKFNGGRGERDDGRWEERRGDERGEGRGEWRAEWGVESGKGEGEGSPVGFTGLCETRRR